MSKNGGFLDVVYNNLISRRGLSLQPHPKQIAFENHSCSCWQCHPELLPTLEEGVGIVSVRSGGILVPRFWKTALDGQPCGFVKEARPGDDGYVWVARTSPHACSCKSGYMCTVVLRGKVAVEPDGDDY